MNAGQEKDRPQAVFSDKHHSKAPQVIKPTRFAARKTIINLPILAQRNRRMETHAAAIFMGLRLSAEESPAVDHQDCQCGSAEQHNRRGPAAQE